MINLKKIKLKVVMPHKKIKFYNTIETNTKLKIPFRFPCFEVYSILVTFLFSIHLNYGKNAIDNDSNFRTIKI